MAEKEARNFALRDAKGNEDWGLHWKAAKASRFESS